jgi:ribosomal protein S18 acetylase RimI-like enzyme
VTDSAPIRVAGNADKARIAAMLAGAFADDPAMRYIFPDPVVRARKMPGLFRLLFDEDAEGMRLVTPGGEAATLWRGPGRTRATYWDMLRQALPMIGTFGAALGRAIAVSNAIDLHFPRGDYWYLHIAGCDPAAQGRGLGAAAVRAGLERVVGSGLPAYLETATERNLGFYRAIGFEVMGDWQVAKDGPRFWSMWREAGQ